MKPIRSRVLVPATAALVLAQVATAQACELKLIPVNEFNGTCSVVVGFADGERVGPFSVSSGPAGEGRTRVGSCEGYVPVDTVNGDHVTTRSYQSPGGTVKAATYVLSNNCRTSTKY